MADPLHPANQRPAPRGDGNRSPIISSPFPKKGEPTLTPPVPPVSLRNSPLNPFWPATPDLPRFHGLLQRLLLAPERVGEISLAPFRDVALPPPPPLGAFPPHLGEAPESVQADWLAGVLAPTGPWLERGETRRATELLLHTARSLRHLPDWTLTAIWMLEVALCWAQDDPSAVCHHATGELGDLYCQATHLHDGLDLLARAEHFFDNSRLPGHHLAARTYGYRAARWRARVNPVQPAAGAGQADVNEAEVENLLLQLSQVSREPDAISFHAELELLGMERVAGDDKDGLVRLALDVQGLLRRSDGAHLRESERLLLRAQAEQLLARAFSPCPNRYIRGQARAHFARALELYRTCRSPIGEAGALDGLGRVLSQLGEHAAARDAFFQSIAIKQQLRDFWGLGASLNGLANLLVRTGDPSAALPLYEADVHLLRLVGGMDHLIARNLSRHLAALLWPNQNPFARDRPDASVLRQALQTLTEFSHLQSQPSPRWSRDPQRLLLRGAWNRVTALATDRTDLRQSLLTEGRQLLEESRLRFLETSVVDAGRAALHLAHLLLDLAQVSPTRSEERARARVLLEEAEHHLWDGADRTYLELVWAWWYEGAGQPHLVQRHLAAARRAAELTGSRPLALQVDSRLGAIILGPTGEPSTSVVLAPGEELPLQFRVVDWRGLPLPDYLLAARVESDPDSEDAPLVVSPVSAGTDHLGRARFTVRANASGRHELFVGDAVAVQGARVLVHVQPGGVEGSRPGTRPAVPLAAEEELLLRQLFGPGYSRLRVHRQFSGGRSGARVLLVEPFRHSAPVADGGPGGQLAGELRGQPCIVKLGERVAMHDEWRRHDQWVKDILPVNVSRCERHVAWGGRAALRMGLAGSQDWSRIRDACEWLTSASPFDAHLLLERVFVGDLASCWYANSPRKEPPRPLATSYGAMVPPLLLLEDTDPPRGLLTRQPAGPFVNAIDGLLPPDRCPFQTGDEVALDRLTVTGYRPFEKGWEYELRLHERRLRVTFRTPLPPEQIDRDGIPEQLLRREAAWSLRARVLETAHDRLESALRRSLERFARDHPHERISLSGDGTSLLLADGELPNPLLHLHPLLERQFPVHRSVIHGDLHGRNVIVGPQGQPFYIDFGKTGPGPTLFDFIKFEVYLWHDNYASWPSGPAPAECSLSRAHELLEDFSSPDPRRCFPSPYALLPSSAGRGDWLTCLVQCLATLRSAARPYILSPEDGDYFGPLCLCAATMLRWCDPARAADDVQARTSARQGVMHALLAGSLLAGALAPRSV